MSPVTTKARVGTARWYQEQTQRVIRERNVYEDALREVVRDLEPLRTDLANGCSVTVASRELTRTLDKIRKVMGDRTSGTNEGSGGSDVDG